MRDGDCIGGLIVQHQPMFYGTVTWPGSPDRAQLQGRTAVGVAQAYRELVDVVVADAQDEGLRREIEATGVRAVFANTLMKSDEDKIELAKTALASVAHEALR